MHTLSLTDLRRAKEHVDRALNTGLCDEGSALHTALREAFDVLEAFSNATPFGWVDAESMPKKDHISTNYPWICSVGDKPYSSLSVPVYTHPVLSTQEHTVSGVDAEVLYEQLTRHADKTCTACNGRGVFYGNVAICQCVMETIEDPPLRTSQLLDLDAVFKALHRSAPIDTVLRTIPAAEQLHADALSMVHHAIASRQHVPEKVACVCGLTTCVEPWEDGCGLGRSEAHVRAATPEETAAIKAAITSSPRE